MVFTQTMNTFCIVTKNSKDIEFINLICNWQPPNDFTIPYLFCTNKLVQKHNENVFTNTLGPMFIFKAMDINHQSCPPSYKLSNDSSKTMGLHSTINICWLTYVLDTMQHLMILWIELMTFLKHQQHILKKSLCG